jgi:rare lipoprotein A
MEAFMHLSTLNATRRFTRTLPWQAALCLVACVAEGPADKAHLPEQKQPPPAAQSPAPPPRGKSYVVKGKRYTVLQSAEGFSEKGKAYWYGKRFHGRKTANGERFDQNALTAAHKTLPLNTWVEVKNLATGKTLQVRINDRGPFTEGGIIDLSRGSAVHLDMLGGGEVEIRTVPAPEPVKRAPVKHTAAKVRKQRS